MIKAKFYLHDKTYFGFSMTGHAEYADPGEDILCAAVSALAFNTANAIDALTKDRLVVEKEDNSLKVKVLGQVSDAGNTLFKALRVGLCQIYKDYGEEYIRIFFKEVS